MLSTIFFSIMLLSFQLNGLRSLTGVISLYLQLVMYRIRFHGASIIVNIYLHT